MIFVTSYNKRNGGDMKISSIAPFMLALIISMFISVTAWAGTTGEDVAGHFQTISTIEEEIEQLKEKQGTAHKMANSARELGLSEESDTIILAKNIWSNCEAQKSNLKTELDNLKNKVKYIGEFKLTGYCHCASCCGKSTGITASGARATEGVTIAADTSKLPMGTRVYIEGVGERIVQDRGSAVKGNKLDIYVNQHSKAYNAMYNQNGAKVWVLNM